MKKYLNLWYKLLARITSLIIFKQMQIWDSHRFPRQGPQASGGGGPGASSPGKFFGF